MRCGGLDKKIAETIDKIVANGVTAMSMDNLKMITPTNGIVMHRMVYNRVFAEVAQMVADEKNFKILED